MSRVLQVARGIAALAALVALLGGIPWALSHFVGWPLPHHVPSASQVGRALDRQGIPAQALVDALAVVVWLAWASLLASLAAEIPAALAGHHARHLPVVGIFQPMTGRLVAAVLVAGLALAPRPAHPGGPAPLATRLPAAAGRPAAALVLADTASVVAPGAAASLMGQPTAAPPAPSSAPGAPSGAPTTYVVQRGDTLWGIAERELCDPLRWSEIFQLNDGRPEPGGASLTDPHWIDPGWTLLLPPASTAPPPRATPPASPTASQGASPPATPVPPVAEMPPTTPTAPAPSAGNGHVPAKAPCHASNGAIEGGAPVGLPSGSIVAGSFAAGVLSAVALGRMRRRHAYRYRPPQPGRDLTPAPLRPTLAHLVRATEETREAAGNDAGTSAGTDGETVGAFSFQATDHHLGPGRVDIAHRDGETVTAEVTDLSGVAITGVAADDVARALVSGLLVQAGPGGAEILAPGAVAERLLPGARPNGPIRRGATADEVARVVEAERIARARRLDAAGAPDAEAFRHENPENPLPALLVLVDPPAAGPAGRFAALAAAGPRLGISVVYLEDTPAATGRLATDAQRRVTEAIPATLAERFVGAELFGLHVGEAVELLDAVTDSLADEPEPDEGEPEATVAGDDAVRSKQADSPSDPQTASDPHGEPWPDVLTDQAAGVRLIRVRLFGHLSVDVAGEPVASGLRSRAKQLLAWYLLRPEGATSEEAVDALWPDTPPDGVLRQFWRAFGDLRTRLRDAGGESLDVLVKTGEHYQPAAAEIACDLWDLQAALADAARAVDDDAARQALRRAVGAYRGELLQGTDWLWVEPVRADLHRRAVDAHLRLAELEAAAGRPDAAVGVLERAVDVDRYAEEPYRRLMALQAAAGRPDAVASTWRLLQRRLAGLDLEVEPATARLYRDLTAADGVEHAGPLRLSS